MSKGLETWKLVRKHIDYISSLWLKEQRHIENVEGQPLDIIEKELQALEIIITKYINPHDFILCNYTLNNKKWLAYEEYKKAYMNYYENDEYLLLEEEYDLLKEVLNYE